MNLPWFDSQFNAIVDRAKNNKLHHGLLFIGSRGTGKTALIRHLAHNFLCAENAACGQCQSCLLYMAGNHPDLILTQFEKTIGVDVIREGINRLSQTSHLGSDKVMIVENAHKMTVAASNALLKTLEEPTKNTYILMTSTSSQELLPTILSRCEKHTVQVRDKSQVITWLQQNQIEAEPQLVDLYWHKPLLLGAIVKDEGLQESIDWLKNLHKTHASVTIPPKLHDEYQLLLDWLTHQLGALTRADISDAIKLRVTDMHVKIIEAQRMLQMQGVNKLLILERLLQNWRQFNTFI